MTPVSRRPVTPFVGCDVFVLNDRHEVLLIRPLGQWFWALPGGTQDLGESPIECAARECLEESGYIVEVVALWGVYSSRCYRYENYPWKENEYTHLLFRADLRGGESALSSETLEVGWFAADAIPPLSDGHAPRIAYGFKRLADPALPPHFE